MLIGLSPARLALKLPSTNPEGVAWAKPNGKDQNGMKGHVIANSQAYQLATSHGNEQALS